MAKGKPGICSCCSSPHRRLIDVALVARVPNEVIARRFDVSSDSVARHGKNHLSAVQAAALAANLKPTDIDLEALRESEGSSLLGQLLAQRANLQVIGQSAFEAGQYGVAVSAERGVTANLDLLSRVLGLIIHKHESTSTALLISPDYLALRSTLIEALRPYPEAGAAVAHALHRLETSAAETIKAKATGKAPLMIEHEAAP